MRGGGVGEQNSGFLLVSLTGCLLAPDKEGPLVLDSSPTRTMISWITLQIVEY